MIVIDVAALYALQALGHKLLTAGQEQELARRKETGDFDARQELIRKSLRLASALAVRFVGHGASRDDLRQAANLALIRAVDHFKPGMECRLSTYAWRAIIGELCREVAKSSVVPVTKHSQREFNRLTLKTRLAKVRAQRAPGHIDTVKGQLRDRHDWLDELIDRDEIEFELEIVNHILGKMPERTRQITTDYFEGQTLDDIGWRHQISGGRAGQIKNLALRKCRHRFDAAKHNLTRPHSEPPTAPAYHPRRHLDASQPRSQR